MAKHSNLASILKHEDPIAVNSNQEVSHLWNNFVYLAMTYNVQQKFEVCPPCLLNENEPDIDPMDMLNPVENVSSLFEPRYQIVQD